MAKKPEAYATEAAMCAQFISEIPKEWTAYAETAGWDILLSRNADGFQIGIEAKLRLNGHVLTQALEGWYPWVSAEAGPDCRAVLVPEGRTGDLAIVAAYVGLTVITIHPRSEHQWGPSFSPWLPVEGDDYRTSHWHELCPTERHQLPEYVPDVAAGASAPIQLTKWKIAAIRIAVTLEKRGFVTRDDFKHHKIDHRRWLPSGNGWLALGENGFVAGPYLPDFKGQHPAVYAQIAAEAEKWMPNVLPAARQGALL
jgi:hypothetical protein